MIIVTGATGKLGGLVVESLLKKVSAEQVAVSVRDAAKAQHLADQGVSVREASFDDAASLEKAFEGATTVLVISTDVMGEKNYQRCATAIDAAVQAGAERVVYTSHMGVGHDSAFQAGVDHAQVEDHLKTLDIAWTSLRNGFYAGSALQFAEYGLQGGDIAVPADGKVSWTTHQDLADAAAAVLAGEVVYDGPTPDLTSETTADFADIAAYGSTISGRDITRTVIEDEAFVEQMKSYGTPEIVARQLLGIFVAARNNEYNRTGSTLSEIIGRPAATIEDVVKDFLEA